MKGFNNNITGSQIREVAQDALSGVTGEMVDLLAQHVCLMFYKSCRAVPQRLTRATVSSGTTHAYEGVCTGQPHRPGDYRCVADFLDAVDEGSISENGNPANARPRTIRDRLGTSLLLAGHVAEKLRTSHSRVVETLASNPSLYDWWCDVVDECERIVGAMPMSKLLFLHSAQAKRAMQQRSLETTHEKPGSAAMETRRQGTAASRMHENRINGLCRHVWTRFQGQYLTVETGDKLRLTLEEVSREHGPKVTRSVVVRLRTQYDPTSQWCSRELWKQVFDAHIPLDTGTQ